MGFALFFGGMLIFLDVLLSHSDFPHIILKIVIAEM